MGHYWAWYFDCLLIFHVLYIWHSGRCAYPACVWGYRCDDVLLQLVINICANVMLSGSIIILKSARVVGCICLEQSRRSLDGKNILSWQTCI
mmetsp:Transcript_84362/g.225440  ORF Transcript_84362/g.225440 Transcript_84362/m.225440 type:complete len:92 (+) Transcript_84362:433-708(+)